MITKVKLIKYRAWIITITIAAVVFFGIWGHAHFKAAETVNSYDAAANSLSAGTEKSEENVSESINASAFQTDVQAISEKDVKLDPLKSDLNNYVLKVISTYEGVRYPYLLNNDYEHYNGVTKNIIYKGIVIAKANPDGSKSSHCVGLTYEVFFKAMQERNKEAGLAKDSFNNMTVENMKDFLLTWFAALGTPKEEGDQLAGAIVKYGLGTRIISLENVKAGDFIDFSRTKSGHTAVFINWLRDNSGCIVGFKYWSTQESTKGIGYREEYFSDNTQSVFKGTVNRKQLYIGRVGAITSYKSF